MRRVFLAFLCVGLLAVAGSVLMAQTDYGSTDQPATDSDTVSGTTGTTAPTTDPNPNDPVTTPNTTTTTTTDTTDSSTVQDRSTLPATASNTPLVLAIGLFAVGGIVLMRVYRTRYAR